MSAKDKFDCILSQETWTSYQNPKAHLLKLETCYTKIVCTKSLMIMKCVIFEIIVSEDAFGKYVTV